MELPARTSETHTKETHNSTWHLFRNRSLKAADGKAGASESIRLRSDNSRGSISVRTYCSWQRCKAPAEMERQILVFPQPPLCRLALLTPLPPMSLNNHTTLFCPVKVWVRNSHAIFISLLSFTLNILSRPLRVFFYYSSWSLWYVRAHFLHHLVAEAALSTAWNTQISLTKEYVTIISIRLEHPNRSVYFLCRLESGNTDDFWHGFIQPSIHHPPIHRSLLSNCPRLGT